MKKLKPETWKNSFKWQYEAYPFFTSVYQKAAAPTRKKYHACWDDFANYYKDEHFIGLKPKGDILKWGKIIISELLKSDDSYLKEFKILHTEMREAINLCLQLRERNEFENINFWWPKVERALSRVANILFSFDYSLDYYLANLQKENLKDYLALKDNIYTNKPSFINEANNYLLALDKKYPGDFEMVYAKFMEKYGWFQNSYAGIFHISRKWLKNYLKEIREKRENEIKPGRKLPAKYRLLAKTASIGITFRDDKKKLLLIAADLMERWLRNICRKKGWKYEGIRWLAMREALDLISGKKKEYLKKAKVYANKNERIGTLQEKTYREIDKNFWNKITKLNLQKGKTEFIRGMTGNGGKITGKVKIVLNPKKEAGKFENGDILVTSMTRPEFLPLMKKAGAFITDEGGITSHAAIIARELNKPCVIGTKIATQILKDGDIIEINATQGIVKVLKK